MGATGIGISEGPLEVSQVWLDDLVDEEATIGIDRQVS